MECYAQHMLSHCGCIPFYLPIHYGNTSDNIKLCDMFSSCVIRSKAHVDYREWNKEQNGEVDNCNCLRTCSDIYYGYRRSRNEVSYVIKRSSYIKANNAKVTFFFSKNSYTKIIKTPVYDLTDLIANLGGLLGFFTGFSFLSGAEIIVLVILALGKEFYKRHKKCSNKNKSKPSQDYINTTLYPYVN
ncbi:acid-sensing ion channel 5-like [Anthonomus grandis grandis]|uniref:acid-sensing ion channel 5-like n=1 Tax=Anthonomus grandis grandis TaxID=2921223 RepID=UPI0021669E10|nr:acid-sensing ion channel 5-like [Anthonomus grandis grandis]